MLNLTIPASEHFDEASSRFVSQPEVTLLLEHSLRSLSKWESEWEKPFLGPGDKTPEEVVGYLQAMCQVPDVPLEVFSRLTQTNLNQVNSYLNAKMTATWFRETKGPRNREIITAELIYYWMISLSIPLEWETRHLNQLFTLIRVCNQKNQPPKKMSAAELAQRNRDLNESRLAQLKTTG